MKTDGRILPLPVMSVEKRVLKGAEMTVITVMPSDMPPVKYNGRIWIRTGPRRAIAGEQDERILSEKRRYKNLPYDLYPVPSATVADLSRVVFEEIYLPKAFAPDILEANNRTYEERLASCKMIVSPTDTTPTVTGILSLGRNPNYHIPCSYIQFLRIAGTELTDAVIDEEVIEGHLPDVIKGAKMKFIGHNRRAIDVVVGPHIETESYPYLAVEQIIYNAIMHKSYERTNSPIRFYWYDDRIEIISPGGTYGDVTPDNFGQPGFTSYRNPNLSAAMKAFDFVQSYGRGILIARAEMKRNGNSEPEFEVNQSIVKCILRINTKPRK
jgi:ATP-dependent DNA helicase RecG